MHHLNIIQEELELQLASDLELWWEWSFLDFGNFGIPPSDPPFRRNAMHPTNTANLNYTETLSVCVCVCVCVFLLLINLSGDILSCTLKNKWLLFKAYLQQFIERKFPFPKEW